MDMRQSKMLVRRVAALFLTAILVLGATEPVAAGGAVYFVNYKATGAGDGTSWSNAFRSLQPALSVAAGGDQIWVAKGTYWPTLATEPADTRTRTFQLKEGVALYGGFAGNETRLGGRNPAVNPTILSGEIGAADTISDNTYHVVTGYGVSSAAVLDGFTITGGNADAQSPHDRGGGMRSVGGSPTLRNLIFRNNTATGGGGGLYGFCSSPTLTDVTFSGNSTGWPSSGGGMYNDQGSPTLRHVTFVGNSAIDRGGGMFNDSSDATLNGVILSNNSADYGGGIFSNNGKTTLMNVTFSYNSGSAGGGGLFNYYSESKLTNVTFINNSTGQVCGGMVNAYASPILTNVTFKGNLAIMSGGGLCNFHGNTQVRNAIFWANTASDNSTQIYDDLSQPILLSDSVVQGGCPPYSACTNVINIDPKLGALGNYGGFTQTVPLLPGSSAIDKGNAAVCPSTDQRGVPRPQGAGCDIGAYEVSPSLTARSLGDHDGWILESAETSNLGGTIEAAGTSFYVGDNSARKQYRAVLSFNTGGIPANAVIVSARLSLTKQSIMPAGTNPFNTLQGLMIDVRKGFFGTLPRLETADFQSAAMLTMGPFKPVPAGLVYSIDLPSTAYPYINKATTANYRLTQLRLRFKLDDNNDAAADTISFFSGNHPTTSYQPTLVILYYVPRP